MNGEIWQKMDSNNRGPPKDLLFSFLSESIDLLSIILKDIAPTDFHTNLPRLNNTKLDRQNRVRNTSFYAS